MVCSGHQSVMVAEVTSALALVQGGTYIDGTVGNGGHALAIMRGAGNRGRLLGIDRDGEALGRARRVLAPWGRQCTLVQGNFAEMKGIAAEHGIQAADGVLLDLGVSWEQLSTPARGFSFLADGPLDMRMDASAGQTAGDVVNEWAERDLAELFERLGEERAARRIARAIVAARARARLERTTELADLVARLKRRRGRTHPATKVFQALRICVNDELTALRKGLSAGLELLRGGGRLAVLSFHSLEDREVKHFFRAHVGHWESLPEGGRRHVVKEPAAAAVLRGARKPSQTEVTANPRARSARLRAVARL